jgi:hypothetical protein
LVGRHQIGSGEQLLRVKPAVLSGAIDTLLGDALARKNVAFARGSGWDRELAGLQAYKGGADLVIGGEITRFSLKVNTGLTRLTSNLDITMEVDCLLGLVKEGKIVRKTVRMNKKVLKFSADQKSMEQVVAAFLAEIVDQIHENIAEYVD